MNAAPQSTTFRFFGALKSLFSRPDTNGNESPAPQPAKSTRGNPPPPNGIHAPKSSNDKAVILPLQNVIMAMSQELRAKIRAAVTDDLTVSIPLDKIVPQLGKGAVKIPFGDIRRSATHVFTTGTECDHLPVALPLSEILPRVNSSALSRRPGQKQMELSAEVTSPFSAGGQGLIISNEPDPTPAPHMPFNKPMPARATTPASAPGTTFVRRPLTPAAKPAPRPSGAPASAHPITPFSPTPAVPHLPESRPIPMQAANPVVRSVVRPSALHAIAPVIAPVAPMPAPLPAVPTAPPLIVSLAALAQNWPETLRQEIAKLNQGSAHIALPANLVEEGLKRGRVTSQWRTIRSWMQPALGVASVHDELQVDLPLQVLAPMFLAQKKTAAKPTQQKVAVDESIPNLFFGFPQPEAAAPAPVAELEIPPVFVPSFAPAPSPAVAAVAAPSAAPVQTAKPADTNYYVWNDSSDTAFINEAEIKRKPITETEFLRHFPSPNEIVERAAALEGVAGSLIALPDGLMVAKSIPADLNGDTVAAFVPQIFGKMSQCTKELRMGELNNLNFTVGNVPWKIFRVNAVFFAAFGHIGQQMPSAQLAALAGELDRKNK